MGVSPMVGVMLMEGMVGVACTGRVGVACTGRVGAACTGWVGVACTGRVGVVCTGWGIFSALLCFWLAVLARLYDDITSSPPGTASLLTVARTAVIRVWLSLL